MAKQSKTKVAEYVSAMEDLLAMKQQRVADPTRAQHPRWAADFEEAKRVVNILMRTMSGGEIGKGNAILAQKARAAVAS